MGLFDSFKKKGSEDLLDLSEKKEELEDIPLPASVRERLKSQIAQRSAQDIRTLRTNPISFKTATESFKQSPASSKTGFSSFKPNPSFNKTSQTPVRAISFQPTSSSFSSVQKPVEKQPEIKTEVKAESQSTKPTANPVSGLASGFANFFNKTPQQEESGSAQIKQAQETKESSEEKEFIERKLQSVSDRLSKLIQRIELIERKVERLERGRA